MSIYDKIVEFLGCIKDHKDLAGIVLLGSFSSKQGDELSDIDIEFIYFNEGYTPVQLPPNDWEWEIDEVLLDGYPYFSRDHWMSGAYVTADILLDKTGEIQKRLEELVKPGFEYFKEGLGGVLDNYYNDYYRSMKCLRRNNIFGAHAMACSSMEALNKVLYQLNGSLHPYINRLPTTIYKLKTLPMAVDELFAHMTNIAAKADSASQIKVYLAVKEMMNNLGYTDIYEAWEGKLDKEIDLVKQR